jgi:hypothetical protein
MTLSVNSIVTLTAAVSPANATNKAVIWTSDNESVATVSNGTVIAMAAGTATITVTAEDSRFGKITASCQVRVTVPAVPVANVSLNAPSAVLYAGSTATLTSCGVLYGINHFYRALIPDGINCSVGGGCASRLLSRQVQPVGIIATTGFPSAGAGNSLAPDGVQRRQKSQHCIFAAFHFNRKGKRLPALHILYFVRSIKDKPDVTGYYR